VTDTPYTAPEHRAPEGPRWLRGLDVGDTQIDGRGTKWTVWSTAEGGRVIQWTAPGPGLFAAHRKATTTVTPTHPDYPTDEQVIAARRAAAARAKAARR
jgi:hypothetical protein